MKEDTYSVLRARRFELVDAANRPWAALGFNEEGEVQLNLLNRKGNGEILLLFHKEEPEFWLVSEGNTRARLSVTHGEVTLELLDDTAHDCLKLHVDSQGAPHILTRTGAWTDMRKEMQEQAATPTQDEEASPLSLCRRRSSWRCWQRFMSVLGPVGGTFTLLPQSHREERWRQNTKQKMEKKSGLYRKGKTGGGTAYDASRMPQRRK